MNIYFTASTKNMAVDKTRYQKVIDIIESLGHKNSNYVHNYENTSLNKEVEKQLKKKNVYDYQLSMIDKSDLLLADINTQSVTIGYQINYAISKKIPVLVIHKKDDNHVLPVVLTSNHKGLLSIIHYESLDDLESKLSLQIKNLRSGSLKFNFYIDLSQYNFLERESKEKNIPKSELLRKIIQDYINSNN